MHPIGGASAGSAKTKQMEAQAFNELKNGLQRLPPATDQNLHQDFKWRRLCVCVGYRENGIYVSLECGLVVPVERAAFGGLMYCIYFWLERFLVHGFVTISNPSFVTCRSSLIKSTR